MRRALLFAGSIAAAACGLSVTGQLVEQGEGASSSSGSPSIVDGATPIADGGNVDDGGTLSDATSEAEAPCDAGLGVTANAIILPADGGTCPTGSTEVTERINPVPVAGACSCGTCTPTTAPSCAGANFQVRYAADNGCGGGPLTYSPANDTCTNFNQGTFNLNNFHSWTARTPAAGACTAASVTDTTKVTSTALRTCTSPTSDDVVCGAALAGARICVPSAGACSGAFSVPLTLGDGAQVACGACGCSHTGTTCTVDYHGNSTCTDGVKYTINANGVCTATNNASNVAYFKVYATGLSCTSTPGTATASLTNPKTLCCTP